MVTNDVNKFWMNEDLEAEMDVINNEAIPNKWDCFAIILGMEGVGKTTFASQIVWKLKPKHYRLSIDNVVFSPPQFEEALEKLTPESPIMWDEAITGAMSSKGATNMAYTIIMKLTQIRKKKFKIISCIPYIDILNRYYINRCLFACRIVAKDFNDRGYFRFYSQPKIELVHGLSKLIYKYNPQKAWKSVKPDFVGGFGDFFPFDIEEYEKKKDEARQWDKDVGSITAQEKYLGKILEAVKNKKIKGLSINSLAEMSGLFPQQLHNSYKKYIVNMKNNKVNHIYNKSTKKEEDWEEGNIEENVEYD